MTIHDAFFVIHNKENGFLELYTNNGVLVNCQMDMVLESPVDGYPVAYIGCVVNIASSVDEMNSMIKERDENPKKDYGAIDYSVMDKVLEFKKESSFRDSCKRIADIIMNSFRKI